MPRFSQHQNDPLRLMREKHILPLRGRQPTSKSLAHPAWPCGKQLLVFERRENIEENAQRVLELHQEHTTHNGKTAAQAAAKKHGISERTCHHKFEITCSLLFNGPTHPICFQNLLFRSHLGSSIVAVKDYLCVQKVHLISQILTAHGNATSQKLIVHSRSMDTETLRCQSAVSSLETPVSKILMIVLSVETNIENSTNGCSSLESRFF